MKKVWIYSWQDLEKITSLLNGAKAILDGPSEMKIVGAKASIDRVLKELFKEDED